MKPEPLLKHSGILRMFELGTGASVFTKNVELRKLTARANRANRHRHAVQFLFRHFSPTAPGRAEHLEVGPFTSLRTLEQFHSVYIMANQSLNRKSTVSTARRVGWYHGPFMYIGTAAQDLRKAGSKKPQKHGTCIICPLLCMNEGAQSNWPFMNDFLRVRSLTVLSSARWSVFKHV